jgi:outer membrane protein
MQLRKLLCLAVILLLVSTIKLWGQNTPPAPEKLTLQQSVQLAWNNNIPLQQKNMITKSTNIDYEQAKANRLPDLNGNWNNRWNNGRSLNPFTNAYSDKRFISSNIGMNSNTILFSGLRLQSTIRQTDYSYQASKMEKQQTKDELTLNVLSSYLNVLNFENDLVNAQSQASLYFIIQVPLPATSYQI